MVPHVMLLWLCAPGTSGVASEPVDRLPQPDYQRQSSDPVWLTQVVQFHGHLGPSVVAGARFGMAGLRAIEAKGYFDVEVVCEGPFARPPQACLLDGLQVTTGATMGKRTLTWVQADQIAVRMKNTKTGKTVTLRPTAALTAMLSSFRARPKTATQGGTDRKLDEACLESLARKIASLPEGDIFVVEKAQ